MRSASIRWAKYVSMGPAGLLSVYQPVDLMDFVVATTHWNQISPKMKKFVDDEIQIYSNQHFSAIQKADMEAWPLSRRPGSRSIELSSDDVDQFQSIAVPIWYKMGE